MIAAGDLYFDDYMIEFNGTPMGVNMPEDQAFAELSKASHDYYLIDLRNQVDFDNFHIAGAVNVPLSSLVDELDNMPTDKIILVMCYSGQTASYATSIINLIGAQSGHVARNLKFGASGILPIEAVFEHGNYTYPQTNDNVGEMVANAGAASPAKNDPGEYPVLEADVDNDLDALKVRARAAVTAWSTDDCKMSNGAAAEATPATLYLINYWSPTAYANGHLDDAIQYTPPKPSESIESDFLSTKALNTLPTDLPIGVYCYTGQTSAQVAAYLQMVGYDAKTVVYGVQMTGGLPSA